MGSVLKCLILGMRKIVSNQGFFESDSAPTVGGRSDPRVKMQKLKIWKNVESNSQEFNRSIIEFLDFGVFELFCLFFEFLYVGPAGVLPAG